MVVPVFGESTREKAAKLTASPVLVEVQGRLGVRPEEAFRYVTDASRLSEWIPVPGQTSVDDSHAEKPGGVGSVRIFRTGPLPPTRERVVAFEPNHFYAYCANDEALGGMYTDHLSAIGIESHPEGGCVVTWLAYAKPGRSWLLRYVGLRIFRHVLGQGLRNLQQKFPVPS